MSKSRAPLSTATFHILVSLADRQMHGYAILRDIKRRTDGKVELTASTLYTAMNRMLADGWIRESDARPAPELDDERRRYFAITGAGRDALRHEAQRLEQMLRAVRDTGVTG